MYIFVAIILKQIMEKILTKKTTGWVLHYASKNEIEKYFATLVILEQIIQNTDGKLWATIITTFMNSN